MPPHRHRGRDDDNSRRSRGRADAAGDRPAGPVWLAPALLGGGAAVVGVVVLVVVLSRGTPAPAPAPPVGAAAETPPVAVPDGPFRARLVGVWERPPAPDGLPVRFEVRRDGTAELRHQHPGGDVQAAVGDLVAPDRAGPGSMVVQVTLTTGSYGFRCRFDGDDLVLAAGGGEARLRRAR